MFNFSSNQGNKTLNYHELYFTHQTREKKLSLILSVSEGVWIWGLLNNARDSSNWHNHVKGQQSGSLSPRENVCMCTREGLC